MPDLETLRTLVTETMTLLRELIMDQGKQVAEIRELIPELREVKADIERLYVWRKDAEGRLVELSKQQAVNEVTKDTAVRDESRAYQDRKHIWKEIFDIGVKLAGVAALGLYILGR